MSKLQDARIEAVDKFNEGSEYNFKLSAHTVAYITASRNRVFTKEANNIIDLNLQDDNPDEEYPIGEMIALFEKHLKEDPFKHIKMLRELETAGFDYLAIKYG